MLLFLFNLDELNAQK